jgi:cytochrome c biogenesis protein CcmG, thiol:disulfide interchange protein DsbE
VVTEPSPAPERRRSPGWRLWLPLGAFLLLAGGLAFGLARPESTTIASRMVGTAVPDFALAPATAGVPGLAAADLRDGRTHLVNFFASWCVPCAIEAPALARLAAAGVPIVGIAVRDQPGDLADFLRAHGRPFTRIGGDVASKTQLAFGSSGVPETFVVDGRGVIVQQIIGPIDPRDVPALAASIKALG